MTNSWFIYALVVVALGIVGFVGYNAVYDDDYKETPGVVYNDDGHNHDHGGYGVINE